MPEFYPLRRAELGQLRATTKGRRVDCSVFLLESFWVAWKPPRLGWLEPFMSRTCDLNSKQDRMICYPATLPSPLLDSTWSILFSNNHTVPLVAEGTGENATSTCALSTSSIIRAQFSPVNTWPRRSRESRSGWFFLFICCLLDVIHLDFGLAHQGFWDDLGQRKDLACVH